MSQKLISRSADLSRLRSEGYSIETRGGYLLVKDVPYVDHEKQGRRGTLVAKLVLAGDEVSVPDTHTIHFIGAYPHNADGTPIEKFRCNSDTKTLCDDVAVNHQFSAKPQPTGRYDDYHHQVTTYCSILGGPAAEIDRTATARCLLQLCRTWRKTARFTTWTPHQAGLRSPQYLRSWRSARSPSWDHSAPCAYRQREHRLAARDGFRVPVHR